MKTFAEIEPKLRYNAAGITMPGGGHCLFKGIFLKDGEFSNEPFDLLIRVVTSELVHKEYVFAKTFMDAVGVTWALWVPVGRNTGGRRGEKPKTWESKVLR